MTAPTRLLTPLTLLLFPLLLTLSLLALPPITAQPAPYPAFTPLRLAVDASNNLLLADQRTQWVWQVSPSNALLRTFAYTSSPWHFPTGVCVDPLSPSPSAVYIVDNAQGSVYRMDPTNGTLLATLRVPFASTLYACRVAHGRLYLLDVYLDAPRLLFTTRVVQLHLNGSLAASLPLPADFQKGSGRDLAVDSAGYMYVVTEYVKVVLKVSPQGEVVSTFAVGGWYPTGVCVDSGDRLWVWDALNACVWQLTTGGVQVGRVDTTGQGVRDNGYTGGMAMSGRGEIYAVDQANHRVVRLSPNGTLLQVFEGQTPTSSSSSTPAASASPASPSSSSSSAPLSPPSSSPSPSASSAPSTSSPTSTSMSSTSAADDGSCGSSGGSGSGQRDGLTKGGVVGIILGSLVGAMLVACSACLWLMMRRGGRAGQGRGGGERGMGLLSTSASLSEYCRSVSTCGHISVYTCP